MERAVTINPSGAKIALPETVTSAIVKRASTSVPCPAPLKSLASSIVSSVCSCIVTPTISTSTVVKTGPATTVTSTAPLVISTVTARSVTTTITTTVTTTTIGVILSTTTTTYVPSATSFDAPYCAEGYTIGEFWTPQCNSSYIYLAGDLGYSGTYQTVATYNACLDLCDADIDCVAFSFIKTTCVNNCFLLDEISFTITEPQPDPNVDSGNGPLIGA
ncbi:hypothetical protein LTR36_006957 [Oleoguttula mirabilis]|uniref:Apple domain-containing protein n=1 Tax=Oleoguttula mirabilis TaxID=1507867 RepID=A0AAV9JB94_9PEZI|nr:hypothetical protein LTR36_006957 [Oleoguttula mirabilis]